MEDRYLFRGKRIDNGEWVQGCLITDETEDSKRFIGYVIGTDEDGIPHDLDVVQVDPSTICKCVELKDDDLTTRSCWRCRNDRKQRNFHIRCNTKAA
jgi:hypothetical protein